MSRPIRLSLVVAASLATAVPVHAQNREHQQLYAEIAILQEQVQHLRLAVNALNDRVGQAEEALASQTEQARIVAADQRVLIDNLDATLTKFNERLNDNSVRVGQLSTEMSALRDGLGQVQVLLNRILGWLEPPPGDVPEGLAEQNGAVAPPPSSPAPAAANPPMPDGVPAGPPATSGPTVPTLTTSPAAYYQQGLSAYFSTDYETAVAAFQEFIDRFPTAEDADDAHFFLGESLYHLGRFQDALETYSALISRYSSSELVPDAYYKQGACYEQMRQRTEARRVYELIRQRYPNSTAAGHAEQRLEALNLIRDPE